MHRDPVAHPPSSDFFDDDGFVLTLAHERPPAQSRAEALAAVLLAGAQPGDAVLDAGCGVGRHALALARVGYRVTGVDHASTLLEAARAAAAAAPWPRFVQASYNVLPFADASFAAVLSLGSSLGYLGEAGDRAALSEFHRVLAADGRLVIETIHRDQVERLMAEHEERRLPGGATLRLRRRFDRGVAVLHEEQELTDGSARLPARAYEMRLYRPSELARLLRDADFASVAYHGPLLPARTGSSHGLVLVARATGTRHRAAGAKTPRDTWLVREPPTGVLRCGDRNSSSRGRKRT